MKKIVLKIKNLNLNFYTLETVKIFENLNFEVYKNDLIGITAPSGSGKTTLFRLIMKYIKPEKGSIEWSINPALISQTPYLNPYLTVNEILEIEILNNSKNFVIEELLFLTGLKGIENQLFSNISGGQKQRVVLLTKIISENKFILADEPFNALDKKTSEETRNLFFEQLKKWKITTIITSHNPTHLQNMDKIYIIENHRLKEIYVS